MRENVNNNKHNLNSIFCGFMSGEKNHTNCCIQRDVETECLPLCSGQVTVFQQSLDTVHCLQRMPEVASCMEENRGAKTCENIRSFNGCFLSFL